MLSARGSNTLRESRDQVATAATADNAVVRGLLRREKNVNSEDHEDNKDLPTEMQCGLGALRPSWLQSLTSKKVDLVVQGLEGLFIMALITYFIGMEKSSQVSSGTSEGAPKYNPGGRVINRTQASHGQFPYMAALYLNGRSFCGGSLISQRWVLTAAHCASGTSTFTVHLGAQNLNDPGEDGRIIIETTQKIVHSGYSALLLTADIALVNLGEDVPLSQYIQVLKLASGSELYEGAIARASGWGKVSDASTSVSPQLNYVDLNVISNDQCKQAFGNSIMASHICTQGVGVCDGDSGSPLIDKQSGIQIGIASFVSGSGCEAGAPNGFVRVSSYTDWISQNTNIEI